MTTTTPEKDEAVASPPPSDEDDVGISIYDGLETDISAEEDGRWFVDAFGGPMKGDIKLRSFTTQRAVNILRRLQSKYRKYRKNGVLQDDVAQRFVCDQLAQAIIMDWRGPAFRDRDDKPIPHSVEAAFTLADKLPHFRYRVIQLASDTDNYRIEEKDASEKN
jgi:hypothetical protein